MTAANPEAKALADRLYAACNDSGFLGLGGTDEDAVFAALAEAGQKGLMREVEALYAQAHPDEPRLREELEDELSGEDLERALSLYDEGMRQPSKPAPQPGTTGSSSPFNPVHGTLTPNTRKVNLTWEEFLRKYGMSNLFPPIIPTFANGASSATGPGTGPTSPGGSSPSGGSKPSLPSLPDFGKLLTWEADAGRLHVRLEIPKEASLKYPIHFLRYRILECELKLASADSGKATAIVRLIGSPDFTATASIGVSNLKDPTLFAGLVFESTKSTHFEPNLEALKKTIHDAYAELVKLHAEFQALETGASGADPAEPAPPKDPVAKYQEQGKILGKMAGKIADMYEAFDTSRGTNGPEKGSHWNVSLGVNVKLDKSADKPAEENADTIDLTFKAVF